MRELPHAVVTAIEAANVPPLPLVLVRLMQRVEDEDVTIDDLAEIVQQDPGLCVRILTAANSAALHRRQSTHDIRAGLTLLGTRLIRAIATCLAVQRLFEEPQDGGVSADLTDFWRHSLQVAETAHALAVATRYAHPDEAYLAGLLHNVGILLLLGALGERYAWVLSQTDDEDGLIARERANFGTDHGEVGTWLAEQWHLDSTLSDSILFHHATVDQIATATALPKLVWFADRLSASRTDLPVLAEWATVLYGPGPLDDLATLRQKARERVEIVAQAVGLDLPPLADHAPRTLPSVSTPRPATRGEQGDAGLGRLLGDMAVMRPLQDDLFGLESDEELLVSLRESARILFELPRVGFLIADPVSGELSGRPVGGQPLLFRHVRIAGDAERALPAKALAAREIRSSFDDATQPESLLDRQFARAFASEGILVVPMIGKRRPVGVMIFGVAHGQHPRLKRRAPWLLNFGRIAAASLEAWQDAMSFRRQAVDEAAEAFQRQARRIVHEAGNPLGIIKSYLRILDHKLPHDVGVKQELEVLREEIDRVGNIVRRLSELPADTPGGTGTGTAPAELVRELLTLYGAALFHDRGIEVTTQLSDASSTVACDRDSLKQIVLNLWKNAAEAMPRGGRLDVAVFDDVRMNGRRYAEIRIGDNGPGMPESAIRALSHPDLVPGEGERGLGLSIVGRLAARIGCSISCRSKPGSGTTLSLLLPADAAS